MTLLLVVLALILLLDLVVFVVLLPSLLIRLLLVPLCPQVVFCGRGGQKRLALTIDDGPSGPGSEALLTLLRQLQVPATFFLIGSHLERDHRFPRRALQQGHDLGNHLWCDERSAALAPSAFQQQLSDTERAIARAAAPAQLRWRWFRPGGGWFHRAMPGWLAARSYRLVLGSIFPWDTLRPPLWFVRLFVRLNAHPGGILVLHDTPALSGRTLESLRHIIPELRRRGYRFVPLAELLDPAR
ncbi:polysaccharide deacetylase family protein [Synechococcus sp. BA-132 BA5]|uniref:polysaccharide deacetylase family protein n=1 Tax=Synechococcus sp. BA-132 BA5 TaxID=3110252 RepID=UPI002B200E93|nr:polysaccharide deacetylase family protein [Synechococcus sp. BA-132 BA5]MEA5414488.1 polysaccharide deacetylase family protein [Synechococcus sp. BA-132 BA5]